MTQVNTISSLPSVLLMAGGTGGHVFPALAIAEALREQGITIHWLGTQRGLEARVVPAAGIEIHYINIGGLRGKGFHHLLIAPVKIALAIWQSIKVLRQCQPTVVIGMGGFVTGPGGVATRLLRIPLLIHEQNATMGLTNRWLARLAVQVMEAFPNTFPHHYRAIPTGNPLRKTILTLSIPSPRVIHQPLRILIIGGSLGAKALNEVVPHALQQVRGELEVWHQTGELHVAAMQHAYGQATFSARVIAFIEDMASAYQWADLVICRAGAMTISELAQVAIPSILIPYPYAADDHQTQNAQFLTKSGAAILLPQSELTIDKLSNLVEELVHQPARLQAMSIAAKNCAQPTALQQIVELCLKYSKI
ncbi:MAG: undecaprenyldiphospho-muramoylpentapeptide beta-N-acetylglucosaminyltransferase [Beggiatoa sp. IS2]|nr:MAG: undecaprenyldiphospho-muramoylpentapeptide beta-N-acetylglucosaminyltransferase [Beggiatoa sp. IS2]